MSMWIDIQYINTLSIRLERFTRKSEYTYNFRCPVCGDSQTNKTKARGYIFPKKGGLFYKCHNCQASMSLGNLIKSVDTNLYKEYCLDRYKAGDSGHKPHKEHNFVFKSVVFNSSKKDNAFKGVLTPLKKLPTDHEAIRYVESRMIPKSRYEDLYFVDDVMKLRQFSTEYEDKIVTNEPRLILPYFDDSDELVGLSGRAIRGEKLRYLTMKIKEDAPMIFSMNNVDKSQMIYVTEGPIDSLFLPNAVAVGNANLKYAADYLPKENLVLIYDNEPRNENIMRELKSAISNGFKVCVWPKSYKEKDINDLVRYAKLTPDEIVETINKNTFSGAKALLAYTTWSLV